MNLSVAKNTIKEYMNTRQCLGFVWIGIIALILFIPAPEAAFGQISIKYLHIIVFAIILYLGNQDKRNVSKKSEN